MAERTIHKAPSAGGMTHYLTDYDAARRRFSWQDARRALVGNAEPRLNMAYEAVGRQVARGQGDQVAAHFIDRDWNRVGVTYAELQRRASRFANVLGSLGI